jgi:four helix bundle protein
MLKMAETGKSKRYDLEERTDEFARDVRGLVKQLPRTLANIEDAKQLVKASGSVGANYIEANEALSKKDFLMRIKISRKEAKESRYWLRLIYSDGKSDLNARRESLMQEATELTSIFGAILRKAEGGT